MIGVAIAFGLQLLITYIQPLQEIFRTATFPLEWWPGFVPDSDFVAVEIEKFLRRKFRRY